MKRSDFDYALPDELIAQYPPASRGDSRLLVLGSADGECLEGGCQDRQFSELPDLINPGDLLVFNNTRVIPARLYGSKPTGGRVEVFVERVLDDGCLLAQLRASKTPKPDSLIVLDGGESLRVIGREGAFFKLALESSQLESNQGDGGRESKNRGLALDVLARSGHMPLPPYIERDDEMLDSDRYQTVYAEHDGAVAAPTAGLHFDDAMLVTLREHGVDLAFVTLHVGAGTFQSVRVDDIADHRMHSEYLEVSEAVCDKVRATRARGGRVIAVGTTSVRSLETASRSGEIQPFRGETDIFITPGYDFVSVDALITNFHMPESTLMMLVCAFGGYDEVMAAYDHAVEQQYRFFSYGDAMMLTRKVSPQK